MRAGGAAHRARTFQVEGHHYALVHVTGLNPGEVYPYEVSLDGERRWPEPDSAFPPSVIRSHDPEAPFRLAFGSCHITLPHEPPYNLKKDQDKEGRGVDALHALARSMVEQGDGADACDTPSWPDALLLLGDQVYADEVSEGTLQFIRSRRDTREGPGETVADFEEYTHLYYDSWREPSIRWLLSTVPSAMIFDDHDVHDDWNTSAAWVKKMRATPWWEERITGGFMSYWIYQHLGNLSPREIREEGMLRKLLGEAGDAGPLLRAFARDSNDKSVGRRWSYRRDFGKSRLLVVDTRAGRILDEGDRSMVDDEEWRWILENTSGDLDHLLIGTSLPVLLPPALHHAETWNEAVCAGAWGPLAASLGERIRQALDLEHWSAFGKSFEKMTGLLRSVASGEDDDGRAPASIVVLSGDVHHGYLAEADYPGDGTRSAVYQAVCSPLRNTLGSPERLAMRFGWSRPGEVLWRSLARLAGVKRPDLRWRLTHEKLWFENHIGTLELRRREAVLRVEEAAGGGPTRPYLKEILSRRLA